MAFSSYPGTIFSIDDFYVLSSGLVVTETSIANSNPELYKFVDQPDKIVLEFIRSLVANRLARTGKVSKIYNFYKQSLLNEIF